MRKFKLYLFHRGRRTLLTDSYTAVSASSTYNETLNTSTNSRATLNFSIARDIIDKDGNTITNIKYSDMILGSKLGLYTDEKYHEFIVRNISHQTSRSNAIKTVSAEDLASVRFSKVAEGLDVEKSGNIVTLATEIINRSNIGYQETNGAFVGWKLDPTLKPETFKNAIDSRSHTAYFKVSGSNCYNALVELAKKFAANLLFDYENQFISFENLESKRYTGFKLRPDLNLKTMSITEDQNDFLTVLNCRGGLDLDEVQIDLIPTIPSAVHLFFERCVTDWSLFDIYSDKNNFESKYQYIIDNFDVKTTKDKEDVIQFLKVADYIPHLNSALYDIDYFKEHQAISTKEYNAFHKILNDEYRKINIEIIVRSQAYNEINSEYSLMQMEIEETFLNLFVETTNLNSLLYKYDNQAADMAEKIKNMQEDLKELREDITKVKAEIVALESKLDTTIDEEEKVKIKNQIWSKEGEQRTYEIRAERLEENIAHEQKPETVAERERALKSQIESSRDMITNYQVDIATWEKNQLYINSVKSLYGSRPPFLYSEATDEEEAVYWYYGFEKRLMEILEEIEEYREEFIENNNRIVAIEKELTGENLTEYGRISLDTELAGKRRRNGFLAREVGSLVDYGNTVADSTINDVPEEWKKDGVYDKNRFIDSTHLKYTSDLQYGKLELTRDFYKTMLKRNPNTDNGFIGLYELVAEYLSDKNLYNIKGGITARFYGRFNAYIFEGNYTNEDVLTSFELLNEAYKRFQYIAKSTQQFNLTMIDLAMLESYEYLSVAIGDKIEIEEPQLNIKQRLQVNSIDYDLRDIGNTKLGIDVKHNTVDILSKLLGLI